MGSKAKLITLRIRRTESMITLIGVPDVPGVAATVFGAMAERAIPVTMIVQNAPDAGSASITFTVLRRDQEAALATTRDLMERLDAEGWMNDDQVVRLSVVGGQLLEEVVGLAGEFFSILAAERINVLAINTTADVVSCIIEDANLDKAVDLLSRQFGLKVEVIE